jgi:hypothetical protein
MARIQERKAAKDYPHSGIKKGDKYFYVKIKTGPYSSRTIRSLTRPKRWELTSSDFYSQLWQIEDERFNAVCDHDDLRSIAEDVRALGEEQQEKFDNMPEGLQQGDTGQQVEARANGCEEWADAIEQAADELENALSSFDDAITARNADDLPDGLDVDDEDAVAAARQEIVEEKAQEASDAHPGMD